MKAFKIFLVVFFVLGIFCGGFFALGYMADHSYAVWEGTAIFHDSEQLDAFKLVLFDGVVIPSTSDDDRLAVREFEEVASTEEAVVIHFEVKAPLSAVFPYGTSHHDVFGRVFMTIVFGALISLLIFITFPWRKL